MIDADEWAEASLHRLHTLAPYSHLWPDSEDRTRNAVDAAWRADFSRTAVAAPD